MNPRYYLLCANQFVSFLLVAIVIALSLKTAELKANETPALWPFLHKGKWGYIDSRGVEKIAPQFEAHAEFYGTLASVRRVDDMCAIDASGKVLAAFGDGAYLREFHEKRAAIQIGEKWGVVNENGEFVVPPNYLEVQPFSEGFAWAKREDNIWDLLDSEGKKHLSKEALNIYPFRAGLSLMWRRKAGACFVNRAGDITYEVDSHLPPKYFASSVNELSGGLVTISAQGPKRNFLPDGLKWPPPEGQAYRLDGSRVDKGGLSNVREFHEGFALCGIAAGGLGFLNVEGELKALPNALAAGEFSEGFCWVRTSDGVHFIDTTFETKIEAPKSAPWNDAGDFRGELALVHTGGKFIDADRDRYWKGGKWQYIDKTGKVVAVCQLDVETINRCPWFGREVPNTHDR